MTVVNHSWRSRAAELYTIVYVPFPLLDHELLLIVSPSINLRSPINLIVISISAMSLCVAIGCDSLEPLYTLQLK
jgi:hypothetical protein